MPHQQGHMDGLCGVYSIVNALKVVRAESKSESKELFDEIIDHLAAKRNLRQIVKSGMTSGILYNIINDLIPRDIPRSKPFFGRNMTLDNVWTEMQDHLENSETGIGAVIIGLQGKYDHWTVVTRVEGETLFLHDSGGLKRLSRKRVTIGAPRSERIHQIITDEVIFLG